MTMTQVERDLFDFIVNEYSTREMNFSTSWSNYGFSMTEEETLVQAVVDDRADRAELWSADDSNWLKQVPDIIVDLATQAKPEDVNKFMKFASDFMIDQIYCHVREAE